MAAPAPPPCTTRSVSNDPSPAESAQPRLARVKTATAVSATGFLPIVSDAGPATSGPIAKPIMKRLIVSPARPALTPSAVPIEPSAGKFMSMPKDGSATSAPSNSVKAVELGRMCMSNTSLRGSGAPRRQGSTPLAACWA